LEVETVEEEMEILMLLLLVCLFGATVVTSAGDAIVTNRIKGAGTEPLYVAWGTGAGTAGKTDTTLFSEAAEARTAGTSSRVTSASPAYTNDTYQVVGAITCAGAGKTITNAGLFDQLAAGGNMFLKGNFTGVPLNVGDAIQFTIQAAFD
jgi:hypothetical protein